jgi:PAS domain S-box-containing protein
LRAGLAALFALILVSLAAVAGADMLRGHQRARRDAEQRVEGLARTLAEHAAGLLREAEARLETIAARVSVDRLEGEALHRLLAEQARSMPHVQAVFVIDENGRAIADSAASPPRPFNLQNLLPRDAPPHDGGLLVDSPARTLISDAWLLGLSRKAERPDGAWVVLAALDVAHFEEVYGSLGLGPGVAIALLRKDGALLTRWPQIDRLMGADLSARPAFAGLTRTESGVFEGRSLADGTPTIVGWRRVPGRPLIVTVGRVQSSVFAEWRKEALAAALASAAIALLALGLAWLALRQVSAAERTARSKAVRRQRLRDFANAASDWFWEADSQYRLVWISPRFKEFMGLDPAACIGADCFELQRPLDDAGAWRRHREDIAARRPFRNFRCRIEDAAGRLREVSVSAQPAFGSDGSFMGWRGAATDVSVQAAAEARAGAAEARLAQALDLARDGYALFDGAGRFLYANREYLRINADLTDMVRLGERLEDALREAVRRGYVPAAAGREADYVAEAMARLREPSEPRLIERRGRWLRIMDQPLPGGGALAVVRDVTDERNAEAQLREAERLQAVAHVVGGAAHDFNNLLMAVLGNASLARDWAADDPRMVRALDAVLGAARRGGDLTRQLLAYARRQMLNPVVVELDELIREDVETLRAGLPRTIEVETALCGGGWRVLVDRRQFRNVLASLAFNAVDAMPAGGVFRLETAALRLDAAAPKDCAPGDYVRLTVSDDGPGMAPEVAARAFEPFFTTKEVGRASGLGLSMVFGFLRQSGGAVVLRTAPGAGAAFDLYFPRAAGEAAPGD